MVIGAYEVTTEARGFMPCRWVATSPKKAEQLAHDLSVKHASDDRYPNPFWCSDGSRNLAKFYRGQRFAPGQTI
ncbi:hypothetical protein [Methylibium petroleiphilum]|uniref:Uncharacterized protein n=1 Tax=Methylibium petroleiphilum (strain ATCC BAA-1232 / LMG 22953 / PM1) TaxID=420662 RepID=A2SN93_METPP|nr:hypothetical protein [Methylibium petroleiphilum]ABM97032.1 hypothetical protein Mpe_B0257 [Methylibium petroleiphilum PM1]